MLDLCTLIYNYNSKFKQYREIIKMNYNEPNTTYKFFTYTPIGADGHLFSPRKVKVTFDKDTKEIVSFASKPARYAYSVGYTITHKNRRFYEGRMGVNKGKMIDGIFVKEGDE